MKQKVFLTPFLCFHVWMFHSLGKNAKINHVDVFGSQFQRIIDAIDFDKYCSCFWLPILYRELHVIFPHPASVILSGEALPDVRRVLHMCFVFSPDLHKAQKVKNMEVVTLPFDTNCASTFYECDIMQTWP